MTQLRIWWPFTLVSLVLIIGTLGTALASPLYPIYQAAWQLLPSHISFIFTSYMLGCLMTLLFFGRLSNSIGFLNTLKIGVALIILGLVICTYAPSAMTLGIGRFVIGIASGLISTSALIGLSYTVPKNYHALAPQFGSMLAALGFGLGPVIGGGIAQYSTQPLITPYLPIIMGCVACLMLLFQLTAPKFEQQPFDFKARLQVPTKNHRFAFFILSWTAFSAFAVFSLFASLAPSFLQQALGWKGPLVSGLSIGSILFISVIVQFLTRTQAAQRSLAQGLLLMTMSLILLTICMGFKINSLFIASVIVLGIGHGLSFIGSFSILNQLTHEKDRAAITSTYLFCGYLGAIFPILAVGYLSDFLGLVIGIIIYALCFSCLLFILYYAQKHIKKYQNS